MKPMSSCWILTKTTEVAAGSHGGCEGGLSSGSDALAVDLG